MSEWCIEIVQHLLLLEFVYQERIRTVGDLPWFVSLSVLQSCHFMRQVRPPKYHCQQF